MRARAAQLFFSSGFQAHSAHFEPVIPDHVKKLVDTIEPSWETYPFDKARRPLIDHLVVCLQNS